MILSLTGLLLLPGLAVSQQQHVQCTNRDPQKKPLFGETHAHTGYSFDAYSIETKNPPSEAYRYAKGEAIYIADAEGNPTRCAQLVRPLDWAAITDHSEFLGELTMCLTPGEPRVQLDIVHELPHQCRGRSRQLVAGPHERSPPKHPTFCGTNGETCIAQSETLWKKIQEAAEGAYDRTAACRFTSFVGYEWTSMPGFNNRHRNVIFRNEYVPRLPISAFDSTNDERVLWSKLKKDCRDAGTGCDVLTIPHNGNLSNGVLYSLPPDADATYAVERSSLGAPLRDPPGQGEFRVPHGSGHPRIRSAASSNS